MSDIANSFTRLQSGGYLVLDDFLTSSPETCQVYEAVRDYTVANPTHFAVKTLFDRQLLLVKT